MKLSIRNKLFIAVAAVVLLMGIVGYIAFNSASTIHMMLNTNKHLKIN